MRPASHNPTASATPPATQRLPMVPRHPDDPLQTGHKKDPPENCSDLRRSSSGPAVRGPAPRPSLKPAPKLAPLVPAQQRTCSPGAWPDASEEPTTRPPHRERKSWAPAAGPTHRWRAPAAARCPRSPRSCPCPPCKVRPVSRGRRAAPAPAPTASPPPPRSRPRRRPKAGRAPSPSHSAALRRPGPSPSLPRGGLKSTTPASLLP